MSNKTQSQWYAFDSLNIDYLLQEYDRYLANPASVEASLIPIFRVWQGLDGFQGGDLPVVEGSSLDTNIVVFSKAIEFAANIRKYGHLKANIYPLEKRETPKYLTFEFYGLTKEDLVNIPVDYIVPAQKGKLNNAYEGLNYLLETYARNIAFDYDTVSFEGQEWLRNKIESGYVEENLKTVNSDQLAKDLARAEGLEQYLQKNYMNQKRFSVEGLETMMPVMNELVKKAANAGVKEVIISMAHRGRLNALVHVLDQPYEWLISKFEHVNYEAKELSNYEKYNSTGDVKYHLGALVKRTYGNNEITISMANNASHLDSAVGVVGGMTRAAQDDRTKPGFPEQDFNKALALLIHGDASAVGQGVVYESLNYAGTDAFGTGGSIHLISNNRIGFTTYNEDSMTVTYSSDPSKGFNLPVIHLNSDRPEEAVVGIRLAVEYRQKFHKDVMVNLIGYRRLGHNELDEPRSTNPNMYKLIDATKTITGVYHDLLVENNKPEIAKKVDLYKEELYKELDQAKETLLSKKVDKEFKSLETLLAEKIVHFPKVDTKISEDRVLKLSGELIKWDPRIEVFKNVKRALERRHEVLLADKLVDWGLAESLAFASLLEEGTAIRFSGEDSQRGTFQHRNMVVSCGRTGNKFCAANHVESAKVSMGLYNSPLSEYVILGYEYGYSLYANKALVLWEAQFGDFANGAQIMFDQYLSSARKKWGDLSGLVVLLPHGFEGQGPEHSSARLERFLQMSGENNWTVANLSNASQIFHILRRQAKLLGTDAIRPLVIMSPKSLLRNPIAASPLEDFTKGEFHKIIETKGTKAADAKVTKLVLASGRITTDLATKLKEVNDPTVVLTRVEELYPFAGAEILANIKRYTNLKEIVWAQEEPRNQGSWSYMLMNLLPIVPQGIKFTYVGRPEMAAPTEESSSLLKVEQKRIVDEAIKN